MGTPLKPIRLLLSPRARISPISPAVKCLQSAKPSARKKLDYTFKTTPITIQKQADVKITIATCSPIKKCKCKRLLLINTPNKNVILKEGLKSHRELNILGRGSFGTVVRGSYKGEEVAVKVIKAQQCLNETNALHLLHENVIRTIDVIMKNESHSMIIMEYLPEAQQLQSIIDNEQHVLEISDVVTYAIDIASGLSYCHANNLLHLDLKPSNVLVTKNLCKICDFGNSCFIGEMHSSNEGTVQYTDPEILVGKPATFASDVYSLGIVMWQLRHRENPYNALECRDSIIYNVVKFGLRPCTSSLNIHSMGDVVSEEDFDLNFEKLYKSCWHPEATSRPVLAIVKWNLNKLLEQQLL